MNKTSRPAPWRRRHLVAVGLALAGLLGAVSATAATAQAAGGDLGEAHVRPDVAVDRVWRMFRGTQALLGVEGQASDLLDLIDSDGLRLLWHPSLAECDLRPVHQALMDGREHLTVLCVEGSIALAEDGMFDVADGAGKFRIVASLCEQADYVLAMGACAGYGGWQAQPPNPGGAVGLQYTLDAAGGLLPAGWRSRKGLPVIAVAGCPVPAETQVSAIRWALEGAPGGLDRHGRAPMVQPCLPGVEYRGCGTPRRIGLRCAGCTGPRFPGFTGRPLVRWAS